MNNYTQYLSGVCSLDVSSSGRILVGTFGSELYQIENA